MVDDSKFSKIGDELERFIYHLANRFADIEEVMMDRDELVAELKAEMVKGYCHYADRQDLTNDQMKAILRTILDRRVGELRYRFYKTHRVKARVSLSIEAEIELYDDGSLIEAIPSDEPTTEQVLESLERVNLTRRLLNGDARKVFDVVIKGNRRLDLMLMLASIRSSTTGGAVAKISPELIAQVMCIGLAEVKRAFADIRKAYVEACNGC